MRKEDYTSYRDSDETRERVQRYENMQREHILRYFDVHEFEDIIDYYLTTNSLGSATEAVKIGLDQHPASLSIQVREAQVLIDRSKYDQALHLLMRLSAIESTDHEVFFMLGTVYSLKGEAKKAVKYYRRSVFLEQDEKADVAYQAGMNLMAKGKYEEAVLFIKDSLSYDPEMERPYFDLASAYEKIGELDVSEKYFRKYTDLRPYSESGWYGLAIVLSAAGRYDEAIDAYDFVLAIDEDNSPAYFNKANVLFLQQKYREAAGVYEELLEIDPDDLNALIFVAECYEELGDFSRAETHLLEAMKVDPDSPETYYGIGLLKLKKMEVKESRKMILKAISLDKENSEYWFALARTFQLEKRFDSAVNAIDRALSLDGTSEEYWLEKGIILWENGSHKEALETLERGLLNTGESAPISYRLGIFYIKVMDFDMGFYHIEHGLIYDYELYKDYLEAEPDVFSMKEVQDLIRNRDIENI